MRATLGWLGRSGAVVLGLLAVMAGLSGTALAHKNMPEIDPGSMANALLILSGGLLIVAGRRPRKQGPTG
jgi:uncharacterized membrane protein YphA (DoxX/SURF4 family)